MTKVTFPKATKEPITKDLRHVLDIKGGLANSHLNGEKRLSFDNFLTVALVETLSGFKFRPVGGMTTAGEDSLSGENRLLTLSLLALVFPT